MKAIIVGCGRIGAGLAQTLSQRGHTVTVIDKDPAAFQQLGTGFKGQMIDGVGFDRDILVKAGIERADGLAAVTNSDEVNVVTAQIARQVFHVPQVVTRLYDPRHAEVYHRLGLQTISPNGWGINRIADLLCHAQFDVVLSLGESDVELVEVDIPPLLVNRTVNDLTLPNEIVTVSIVRQGKAFIPTLGTVFEDEDRAYLAVTAHAMERLSQLLEVR
jgi:trk system potassium uptake protein TrkA